MTKLGYPPVIMIGSHRSGTSLLASLLFDLGLFVGQDTMPKFSESKYFVVLNNAIFLKASGFWDNPFPVPDLIADTKTRQALAAELRSEVGSMRVANFLGMKPYLRYRSLYNLDFPWGWKDPRNTFTLPLWLDVFGEARAVNIIRHGVDVAASLHKRAATQKPQGGGRKWHRELAYRIRYAPGEQTSYKLSEMPRTCATLEGAFALWEAYAAEAARQAELLGDRSLSLQYESFLEDPQTALCSVAEFCGLQPSEEAVQRVTARINPSRAFAYRSDENLVAFAQSVQDRLAPFGYE
jgi:Sulfotransferase family